MYNEKGFSIDELKAMAELYKSIMTLIKLIPLNDVANLFTLVGTRLIGRSEVAVQIALGEEVKRLECEILKREQGYQ